MGKRAKKPLRPRDPFARELAENPYFRHRVKPGRKKYVRKEKHRRDYRHDGV